MEDKVIAYCVKCRTKKEMTNKEKTILRRTTKTGKKIETPAVRGNCVDCKAGMYAIVKKS